MAMPEVAVAPTSLLPNEQIIRIVVGFFQSRALAVANELELAEALADGPLRVEDLANRTNTDPVPLFRLMRALESIGVFKQVEPRVFANTPTSECLRRGVPGSQWATVRTMVSVGYGAYEAWAGLLGSIQTGQAAFDNVHGFGRWEFLKRNPEVGATFNLALRSASGFITPAITSSYDWSKFPLIADIGGGVGTQLLDILDRHPNCHGILFDLPQVVAEATLHERLERVGGDFFASVPPDADAYLLRWVIHDWVESKALVILRMVRAAMKPSARLMLVESVISDAPGFDFSKWSDVNMLVMTGGRERTAAEYRDLYSQAGFDLEQIVPTRSPLSIIIGRPHDGQ